MVEFVRGRPVALCRLSSDSHGFGALSPRLVPTSRAVVDSQRGHRDRQGCVVVALATFVALFLLKLTDASRLFLLLLFPAQTVWTIVSRTAIRSLFVAATTTQIHGPVRPRRGG